MTSQVFHIKEMTPKVSVLDILSPPKNELEKYSSQLAFYTGVLSSEIKIGDTFTVLSSTKSSQYIFSKFKIERIIMLAKDTISAPKGYHAIIFLSSQIQKNEILSQLGNSNKTNTIDVCEFS
ncbi:hypothetical protein [Aureibacter tunicatorum]|uniref:Uncharacterized protein n=1 Tax=Aureibacter tunicatorum TaxID=866807 RepID=A0AAE3XMQ7_9BACT|nr:hypothetical protein [Aureibacter tunicatorum]MDR6239302.1 hypothetical protein [Aureibacter tunicatorum]BDD04774.1 hypothetical protein AUTU_22570 [Aureibacter tunicatorum]